MPPPTPSPPIAPTAILFLLVLPVSNSLGSKSQFSNTATFRKYDKPQQGKLDHTMLDSYTFSSRKLFPHISYEAILDYAKAKGILPQGKFHVSTNQPKMENTNTAEKSVENNGRLIFIDDNLLSDKESSDDGQGLPRIDYDTGEEEGSDDGAEDQQGDGNGNEEPAPPPIIPCRSGFVSDGPPAAGNKG